MSECPITLFTPTYNRADKLPRLRESLLSQTILSFEWLIVDDGSTDDTDRIVRSWMASAPFEIRYIRQRSRGKHVAHNRAAVEACGQYFLCVDSDDWLEPDAVETILADLAPLDESEGLIYPKLFAGHASSEQPWLAQSVDRIELADMRMRYGLVLETAIVFKTNVLRRHPFPVVAGEKYMPEESAYYDFIAPELFKVSPHAFYRCEYLRDGLTSNRWSNWASNPNGTRLALQKRYETAKRYSSPLSIREKISAVAGIESLNLALGRAPFFATPGSRIFSFSVLPLAAALCRKRFGDTNR